MGVDLNHSRHALELAHEFPQVFAGVGHYPTQQSAPDISALRALGSDERTVAVGEVGLDFVEGDGPAREVQALLRPHFRVEYDQTGGHIGRRYRRQDEIGTPFCVTVDFETVNDRAVTIRERDSMSQERVPVAGLQYRLRERFA